MGGSTCPPPTRGRARPVASLKSMARVAEWRSDDQSVREREGAMQNALVLSEMGFSKKDIVQIGAKHQLIDDALAEIASTAAPSSPTVRDDGATEAVPPPPDGTQAVRTEASQSCGRRRRPLVIVPAAPQMIAIGRCDCNRTLAQSGAAKNLRCCVHCQNEAHSHGCDRRERRRGMGQ